MRLLFAQLATFGCCISLAACSPANGVGQPGYQPAPAEESDDDWDDEDDGESQGAGGSAIGTGGSKSQGTAASGGGKAGQGGGGGAQPLAGNGGQASGAGGTSAAPCAYPTTGFGAAVGDVIDPSTTWTGYAPGSSGASTLSVSSFLDCDGSAGRNALLLIHSTSWCTSCQQQAAELDQKMSSSWAAAGVVVVEIMIENANGDPATAQTAKSWKDYFGIKSAWVTADPQFQLRSQAADTYPYEVLVDPRTMKIVETQAGGSMDDAVMQLATQNAN